MASSDLETHDVVERDGVRLHCTRLAGRAGATPVVLVHGFPECSLTWRHQAPALARAGHAVVMPDLRGYHRSDKPAGVAAYRLEELVEDLAAIIASTGAPKVHVVGHDWGGAIAWWLAMWRPELVERLVVINCPHPAWQLTMMGDPEQLSRSAYMLWMQLPWISERRLAANDFAVVRKVFRREPAVPMPDADIERSIAALRASSPRAMMNYYRALLRRNPWALRRAMRPIDLPVQVIWGDADRHLGFAYAEPPAKWVWHCRFDVIAGASHWVHVERSDEVNAAILDFFGHALAVSA